MISKPISDIREQDIIYLIENSVTESRTLDYKERLPGETDDAKKEFLADISSFANASGGEIIFGVSEVREGNKATGLPKEIVGLGPINVDHEKLRLENIIRDGLDPRVQGIQIHFFECTQGSVCVIRIPNSWAAPHMVTYKMRSQYYSRNSAGKYPLDASEIRSAFIESDIVMKKIDSFVSERLGRLVADETPINMRGNGKTVLHVIPIEAFAKGRLIDLQAAGNEIRTLLPMHPSTGIGNRYNLDGFLAFGLSGPDVTAQYTQVFRKGAIIECADGLHIRPAGEKLLPFSLIEIGIIEALGRFLQFYQKYDINPPFEIRVSLLGVREFGIRPNVYGFGYTNDMRIDRDTLVLPGILLEDLKVSADIVLKPIFDALWNACGWAHCQSYGDDGRWRQLR